MGDANTKRLQEMAKSVREEGVTSATSRQLFKSAKDVKLLSDMLLSVKASESLLKARYSQ